MSLKKGKMLSDKKFRTPEFRMSFPALFEPHGFEGEDPCYSLTALFDEEKDLKVFEKAIKGAIEDKLNGKRPKNLKITSFRDGDDMLTQSGDPRPECQGQQVIKLKAKNRKPKLIDRVKTPIVNPEEIYGGCYAVAVVEAYYWKNSFGQGISFGLLGVQKTRDGDHFIGGVSDKDFDEYDDLDDDEDGEF